jgi:hypothetical protein
MSNIPRGTAPVFWTMAMVVAANLATAQTPAQMEYERQQREYRLQQEQQRQEQQRQQQLMQDNARRQQEESSRINAGNGQAAGGGAAGTPQGRAGTAGAGDNLSAARATWQKRPALAADHNPLLGGRWTRPASNATNSSDPFAGLQALAKGGLCEALFGGGMFEFRADRLVGMDQRTPEQELDRVEYRGDAKHVVVIPKTTLKVMEFDVVTPDRISWAAQNCVLVRVGAAPARAAAAAGTAGTSTASAAPSSAAPTPGAGGGTLTLSVGAPSASNTVAGRQLMVLKEDAQVALIKGGIKSTPDATVLQSWLRACYSHAPACAQGAGALKAYAIGFATTDATGHAQTPHLPAGRYWVLSDVRVGTKHVVWNQPVDVRAGDKTVTLDAHNAMPVD